VLGFYCLQGGWFDFGKGSKTLYFRVAHQMFDKMPQRTSSMPRGRGSSSQSSGSHAIVATPPIESRKLILENTFAIKEEFSNNEATSWAVQELKRRGLKKLFKPVASTAYERLVRTFYEHLRYECSRPNVLFSSIDGIDVEVTIADVAAVLKCSHKPPEPEIPWIDCPSMLTIEDIVSDMCQGQYADKHRNAASKVEIPPNLWFIDMVLYRNVCPLGHKTQRRDMFLSALYSFHRGFWCSIPEIIWRQIQKFWEGVHHRVAEHTKTWGLPFPFLITHILRKKGIKGTAADGPIIESLHFGRIQWNQSCSHMPRVVRDPEMMDVDEPVVPEPAVLETSALEPAEPSVEPEIEEEEEDYEETITLRDSDFVAF
jgi:hypothetical protein